MCFFKKYVLFNKKRADKEAVRLKDFQPQLQIVSELYHITIGGRNDVIRPTSSQLWIRKKIA